MGTSGRGEPLVVVVNANLCSRASEDTKAFVTENLSRAGAS